MITLYGLRNCDTVRKSGKWLDSQGIEWALHDYRKHGIDHALADELLTAFGVQNLINRRGTTWRQLSARDQNKITDPAATIELMIANPALIRRPIARTHTHGWLMGYDQLLRLESGKTE